MITSNSSYFKLKAKYTETEFLKYMKNERNFYSNLLRKHGYPLVGKHKKILDG